MKYISVYSLFLPYFVILCSQFGDINNLSRHNYNGFILNIFLQNRFLAPVIPTVGMTGLLPIDSGGALAFMVLSSFKVLDIRPEF